MIVHREEDNEPLSEVEVTLITKDGSRTENTDSSGYLQTQISSQNEVNVTLRKAGYKTQRFKLYPKDFPGIKEIALVSNLPPKPTATTTPVKINETTLAQLALLLKERQWEKADRQTVTVMLQAAGRENEGWIEKNRIEQFSCQDIRRVDDLWLKYSNGKFGFSVQKQIFQEVGNEKKFGNRVGWYSHEIPLTYNNLNFSLQAPSGHLPSVWQPNPKDKKPLSGGWIAYFFLSPKFSQASNCLNK